MGGVFPIITAFYLPLDLQRNLGGPKGYCCLFKDLDWLENWNWEDITLWRSHKFKFGATRTVIGPLKFYLWGSNTCLAPPSSICEDQTHVWSFQCGIRGDQNSVWFPQFYLLLSSYKEIRFILQQNRGFLRYCRWFHLSRFTGGPIINWWSGDQNKFLGPGLTAPGST